MYLPGLGSVRNLDGFNGRHWYTTRGAAFEAADACSDIRGHVHRFITRTRVIRHREKKPSTILVDALEEAGYDYSLPRKVHGKVNHSYISAWDLDRKKLHGRSIDTAKYVEDADDVVSEISLQSILAHYIQSLHSIETWQNTDGRDDSVGEAAVRAFDDESLTLLEKRGFDVEDVISWAWILTAQSSEQAALRLLAITNKTSSITNSRIPTFVFLFLLRRQTITASALRLLIIHAWDRIENRHNPDWAGDFTKGLSMSSTVTSTAGSHIKEPAGNTMDYPIMDEVTIAVMLVRLFRHAKRQWPAGYTSIAAILTKCIGPSDRNYQATPMNHKTLSRLTFVYNKMLSFLALPTTAHPFLSISHQERAQFNILRRMNEFEPALSINREGFRAVARVQLGHHKTIQERRWARLKSKSWPPWKEEKLGTDAQMSVDMGKSRAAEALSTLKDSGYAHGDWEDAAMILAGWDTDRSPTIQTRTILAPVPSPRLVLTKGSGSLASTAILVWEARVRATRTINEAWACFLSYKGEDLPSTPNVYLAMLQKIAFEEKRQKANAALMDRSGGAVSNSETQSPLLPGDGPETAPVSSNPRDQIYVRTSPPNFRDFYTSMIADGIIPTGRLLSFLLDHAETLGDGFEYLRASTLSPNIIQMLLGHDHPDPSVLSAVPQPVFSSFIGLLTRSSVLSAALRRTTGTHNLPKPPLWHATQLMLIVKPKRHVTWNSLLTALAHKDAVKVGDGYHDRYSTADMTSWHSLLWIVDEMKKLDLNLDFRGFHTLCIKYRKIAYNATATLRQLKDNFESIDHHFSYHEVQIRSWQRKESEANEILHDGLARLKEIFKKLISMNIGGWDTGAAEGKDGFLVPGNRNATYSPSLLLPRLLEVPGPTHLHAFIRALGAAGDSKGIRDLLRWMEHMAPEMKAAAEEPNNGPVMFRRALIAARVYLERSLRLKGEKDVSEGPFANFGNSISGEGLESDCGIVPSSEEQEAREIVGRVEGWGGWPTDEEVEAYLRKSDFVTEFERRRLDIR